MTSSRRFVVRSVFASYRQFQLVRAHTRFASTQVCSISASPTEAQLGRLTEQNLEKAIRHLTDDGLVVVENAIEHHHLEKLEKKMTEDALYLSGRGKDSPFNYNVGNIQQDAPPIKAFFERSIFFSKCIPSMLPDCSLTCTDPLATHVTSTLLGPRPKVTFMSGNSAMPPTPEAAPQRQPVHSDADFSHPSHPFALVVNVPLVTMKPENGSTEVWLGTHNGFGLDAQEGAHGERASGRIREALLEQRRTQRPPEQPVIPRGSVVIRDLRLWHAGMPNHSKDVRTMLAMIHFAPWYRNQMKLELAEELEPMVQQEQDLDVRADYIPGHEAMENYLNRGFGNSYDFGQSA